MNAVYRWFQGLATVNGIGYFFAGFVSSLVLYWIWCMIHNKQWYINWRYVGIAVGVSMVVFVSLQTQVAYTVAAQTASEVQVCQREFNLTLRQRSAISEDNDHWSQVQRKAMSDWLFAILVPPPDIAEIRANDPNFGSNPRYLKWGIDVTTKYSNIMQDAQHEQDLNMIERAKHPLPEPTCGA